MHGRYEVADLLKLRQSPLVAKPKSLPPIEEWMGTIETKRPPTTRGRFDENQTDGFQKRPTLLDTAARRSTTDAAGIQLAPPRNSFASSNATRNRNGTHERTKTNDDLETRSGDRRNGNLAALSGKLGMRTEAENESSERPRRRIDEDEGEPRPRRDYDRPRWNTRDNPTDGDKIEDLGTRNSRDGYSRDKFNQPWVRKEKVNEQDDGRRENPAWRRGQRDRDVDKQDAEPEWVDSVEAPEPVKQHTHEDFLRWKESMTGKPAGDGKPLLFDEPQEKIVEPDSMVQPRIVSDPITSGDKFFAKFEENKGSVRPTKSRFANIFGPKEQSKATSEEIVSSLIPVPVPAELEQPPPPAPPAQPAEPEKKVDADFAKLLAMLSKNEGSQTLTKLRPARSPLNIAELASARSPDVSNTAPAPVQTTRTPVSTHTPQPSLDRLMESRSPAHHEQTMQAKPGAQELLELLQRSNLQERQEPRPMGFVSNEGRTVPPPPGLSSYHDRERSGPPLISTRREAPRPMYEEPNFPGFRNEPQQYRQQYVSPPPQKQGFDALLAAMQEQQLKSESRPAQNQQIPPGLQRPPGLDSRPPPGWMGNPPPPQRQPSQQLPNFNIGPQQHMFNSPNQPIYAQSQQQQQPQPPRESQRPPQRKATGDLQGFTNYPPPGFGPSPTYPSLNSPDQFGPMRNDYGFSDRLSSRERPDRQPQPQPQHQNPFASMYGNANVGRGGGGGVQLPPGFR